MPRTAFLSTGFHVPARLVTNDDLAKIMDTSDEWIVQRSGIKTRYWVDRGDTGVGLARAASQKALDKAGLEPKDLDCIIYCTCTPDHFEPGNGVFLQRELGLTDIPAVDVRNQCSGFIYGLSIADAWIRTGQYKCILLVGAEVHSRGLDKTTRGRDTAVLFGDGAGAAVLAPVDDDGRGVLSTHIFADGRYAEKLWVDGPGLAHDPYVSVAMLEVWRGIGFWTLLFLAALISLPEELYQAAKVDGASSFSQWWHITMPLLRPTFVFAVVMATIWNFQVFDSIIILTDGAPNYGTASVAWYVYKQTFTFSNIGVGAAMSVLMLLAILALTMVQLRVLRRRSVR